MPASLHGKRVLVTRAGEQAEALAGLLRAEGAETVLAPAIVIGPPSDPAPLERAVRELGAGAYAWVAFASANAVRATWDAAAGQGVGAAAFGRARLAAVGPGTAAALEAHGLKIDVVARESRGEGLAAALLEAAAEAPPGRVLVPRASKARSALPDALRGAGYTVDAVIAYETRPPPAEVAQALVRELAQGRVDAVTFTSGSTVDHVCDLLGDRAIALLAAARVASIGPVTTEAARARGVRVDVTAPEPTLPALVRALAATYRA